MTRAEFEQKYGTSPSVSGAQTTQPKTDEVQPRSTLGKVAEFLAPTATKAFGKAREGEDLTARDFIGSALEVGSFFLPVGAVARGIGLAGKGALTLGRKAALGALGGGAGAGTFEAGRAIGEEGTTPLEIVERTASGIAFGTAFGTAVPFVGAGFRAARRLPQTTKESTGRIAEVARRIAEKTQGALRTTGEITSGIAGSTAEKLGRIPGRIEQMSAQRAEKTQRIAKSQPHIGQAIKKNVSDEEIILTTVGSNVDKKNHLKMLNIVKKVKEDPSFSLLEKNQKLQNQAKEVAGQTIVQGPAKYLIKVKDQGVKKTKSVLDSLTSKNPGKRNARVVYDQFIADMQESGLVPIKGKLVPQRGSKIPEGDVRFYQQVFNELRPDRRGITPLMYKEMHGLRQKWFDVAKSDKTFTGGTTSYARRLRGILAQQLDAVSNGQYSQAQIQTREAMEGLQKFARLMGHKGKIEDIVERDLKSGEVFTRIFGNAKDRPNEVIDILYETARRHGYKGQENAKLQLKFADLLEDVYGSPQTTALRGQVARASDPALDPASLGREAFKWSPTSAALRLTRNLAGLRPEDVLKAFENMVRAEAGQKIPTNLGRKTSIKETAKETVEATRSFLGNSPLNK